MTSRPCRKLISVSCSSGAQLHVITARLPLHRLRLCPPSLTSCAAAAVREQPNTKTSSTSPRRPTLHVTMFSEHGVLVLAQRPRCTDCCEKARISARASPMRCAEASQPLQSTAQHSALQQITVSRNDAAKAPHLALVAERSSGSGRQGRRAAPSAAAPCPRPPARNPRRCPF